MSSDRPAQSGLTANLESRGGATGLDAELAAILTEFRAIETFRRSQPLTGHGGLSGARLWRVDTVVESFALRQWPAEHPSAERLQFIHAVVRHAFQNGMALLPVPLATRGGNTFVLSQDRLWELAPWLPGTASFEHEPSPGKIVAAMRALASFHLSTAGFSPRGAVSPKQPNASLGETRPRGDASLGETRPCGASPGLVERAGRMEKLGPTELLAFRRAVTDHPIGQPHDFLAEEMLVDLPGGIASVRPLLRPAAEIELPLQPCLRDIWHGNLLFSGEQVTGIVDFGAVQIDWPALDVARLLGSMAGDDPLLWRQGLAAYEAIRPLSPVEQVAVRAADASGTVLGCVNWLRWLYVEHRQFGDLRAVEMRMKSLAMRLRWLANA